jgi:hypothetical protein
MPRCRDLALRFLLGLLLIGLPFPASAAGATARAEACFAETGFCVRGRFLEYWQANGGLSRNGFPLSEERRELLEDGSEYTVQYFERVRLEYHPENAPPYDVLLGQFGRRVQRTAHPYGPADAPVAPLPGQVYFPETGHNLGGDFYEYWRANGGLAQFGYPIGEQSDGVVLEDGRGYTVQYFERARFEFHPENPPEYRVLLGQFGRRILAENALVAEPFRYWFIVLQRGHTPLGPATATPASYQTFERGAMLYRADTRQLLVFPSGPGREYACYTTTDPGEPQGPAGGGPGPAPGLYEPAGRFYRAWGERARELLGYATTPGATDYTMTNQVFQIFVGRALYDSLYTRPDGLAAHSVRTGGSNAPSCDVIALR